MNRRTLTFGDLMLIGWLAKYAGLPKKKLLEFERRHIALGEAFLEHRGFEAKDLIKKPLSTTLGQKLSDQLHELIDWCVNELGFLEENPWLV